MTERRPPASRWPTPSTSASRGSRRRAACRDASAPPDRTARRLPPCSAFGGQQHGHAELALHVQHLVPDPVAGDRVQSLRSVPSMHQQRRAVHQGLRHLQADEPFRRNTFRPGAVGDVDARFQSRSFPTRLALTPLGSLGAGFTRVQPPANPVPIVSAGPSAQVQSKAVALAHCRYCSECRSAGRAASRPKLCVARRAARVSAW